MLETISTLNVVLWFSVAFVFGIGHLTYANFYQKLEGEGYLMAGWILFAIAFVISTLFGIVAGSREGLEQGWYWFTQAFMLFSIVYYICIAIILVICGYIGTHNYFKQKRGH